MSQRLKIALVLVGAFSFGLIAAWLKGPASDGLSTIARVRSDIGNLSAPWLLVAFVAGTRTNRWELGALLGVLATMFALFGFYLLFSVLLDLGGSGIADNFGRALWANRVFLASGAISGPLFGALVAWWRKRRSMSAGVLVGALLIGEPVVLALLGILSPVTVVGRDAISIAVHGAELATGLVILLVAIGKSSSMVGITD
jgi:hypothetical protein